jgi:hypothetical protein
MRTGAKRNQSEGENNWKTMTMSTEKGAMRFENLIIEED